MECVLCKIWERMPHAKKPTTPTTVQDTEVALVIGYWLGISSQSGYDPHGDTLCKRHATVVQQLARMESIEGRLKKKAEEKAEELGIPVSSMPSATDVVFRSIQQIIAQPAIRTVNKDVSEPFRIGLEPLHNENSVAMNTAPAPGIDALCAPYLSSKTDQQVALEAAKAAPTEGGKGTYNCPLCGEVVVFGEVHAC